MTTKTATVTVSEATTPNGDAGWRIECTCRTHKPGQTAAVVKRHADGFDRKLVHGWVPGLHTDPLLRRSSALKGKGWPA